MEKQDYELKDQAVRLAFEDLRKKSPQRLATRLSLSWSNWGFGMEPLAESARRLAGAGLAFVELHGNHYGPDLGYKPAETRKIGAHAVSSTSRSATPMRDCVVSGEG